MGVLGRDDVGVDADAGPREELPEGPQLLVLGRDGGGVPRPPQLRRGPGRDLLAGAPAGGGAEKPSRSEAGFCGEFGEEGEGEGEEAEPSDGGRGGKEGGEGRGFHGEDWKSRRDQIF